MVVSKKERKERKKEFCMVESKKVSFRQIGHTGPTDVGGGTSHINVKTMEKFEISLVN